MKSSLILVLLSCIFDFKVSSLGHNKVVVCYVGTWAAWRPDRGAFQIENIDPSLCTHLVYSFAGLDVENDGIRSLDKFLDLPEEYGKNWYGKFVQLKKQHTHLKVTLAIGGWGQGSSNYSAMAANPVRRARFVTNALAFVRKYDFDGLDLDWEFPGKRGGSPADKQNFVALVKELHALFSKHNLLLTAAFSAAPDTIDVAYDVPILTKYLDFIHMMCYDYHGSWDLKTGANAPFNSDDLLSVEYSVQYMIKLGATRNKLVVGIPLYGRTFTLTGPEEEGHRLGAPATNEGFSGPYSRENGFMGYNEICLELQNKSADWQVHWDDLSRTPFAVNGKKVITYDDPKSINEKVQLVAKYRLAGAMVWSLETDDFHGDCHKTADGSKPKGFPLMHAIHESLTQPGLEVIDITENEIDHGDHGYKGKSTAAKTTLGHLCVLILSFIYLI